MTSRRQDGGDVALMMWHPLVKGEEAFQFEMAIEKVKVAFQLVEVEVVEGGWGGWLQS